MSHFVVKVYYNYIHFQTDSKVVGLIKKTMVFKLKSQKVNTQRKLQSILSDIIRPLIDQQRRQTTML